MYLENRGGIGRLFGIDLLRIVMCFGVVMCHFWIPDKDMILDVMIDTVRQDAVPTFMVLAFFFSASVIENVELNRLGARMIRLLKPYFIWPIILFGLYNVLSLIIHGSIEYGLKDLGFQFFMGHTNIVGVLYFNWIVMVLTVAFTLLFFLLPKKRAYLVLAIAVVASTYFVCSGRCYEIVSALPFEMKYPIGRSIELLSSAACGMALSHLDFQKIENKLKEKQIYYFLLCVLIFEILWMLNMTPSFESLFQIKTFGYGFPNQIVLAVLLTLLFINIKGRKLSFHIKSIIYTIAKYTPGVYCIHFFVGKCIEFVLLRVGLSINGTIASCIVIFLASLFSVMALSKIPWNLCRDITT